MKIRFNHVSFNYNKKEKKALDDINLEFNKGEIVFIMGQTGSGKSTLVQHINGLLVPSEGNVNINISGQEFVINRDFKEKNINDLRKNIGLLFQFSEYQLFETSVIKDVMFAPFNFYKNKEEAKNLAIKALEEVGLDESYYEKSPFNLSGGEKRKVAIAGVIASNPSVVIMDEPTSNLDPVSKREIMKLICSLKENGKLVIVISHDTDLCYEYADRVVILNKGKILLDTKVKDAFNDYHILNESGLLEPFVYKVKKKLHINNDDVRSVESLKEVIKYG